MGKTPLLDPKELELVEQPRRESGPGVGLVEEADGSGQPRDNLECSSLGCKLYEVQVEGGSDVSVGSGQSISIEPKMDPSSGLYSIKPKLVSSFGGNHLVGVLPKCGKRYGWGCASSLKSNYKVSPFRNSLASLPVEGCRASNHNNFGKKLGSKRAEEEVPNQ
ncbi:hypothetical protein V6N11_028511 [Hibiscus sabdariffa]|uniref:Uncharacterized protein n=2 Tax=Hibiscus sabdariffa TaxID=183260 RepID=A0ABR1ZR15_9ROSI